MDAEQLALATVSAINDRDRSKLNELATEDVQLTFPPALVFRGRDGLGSFFDELERRVPELTLAARDIYTGPDFAVVEWESSDATAGDSMGCLVLQIRDGQVARSRLYLDTAHWARLGTGPQR